MIDYLHIAQLYNIENKKTTFHIFLILYSLYNENIYTLGFSKTYKNSLNICKLTLKIYFTIISFFSGILFLIYECGIYNC